VRISERTGSLLAATSTCGNLAAVDGLAVLRCRECGREAPEAIGQMCDRCFGPLAVDHRWTERAGTVDWSDLVDPAGPASTPLVAAPELGRALGVTDLWLKDETANPTGSFKDRLVAAALAHAAGARVAACASTGNLGRALACAARAHAMRAVVLVPAALDGPTDDIGVGADVVRVDGPYDAVNRLAVEASMAPLTESWAWVNVGLRPWFVDGAMAIAFEIATGLDRTLPAHVVAPAASGSLACHLALGFDALATLGLVAPRRGGAPVRLSVAQPAGSAPIASAFDDGVDDVAPVRPATAASSLAMGDPPEGAEVLAHVRASSGAVVAVDEARIAGGVALVRETTGIDVEPAGGVVVEALRALVSRGAVDGGPVVAVMSGGPARWPRGSSVGEAHTPAPVTIEPTLAALQDALHSLEDRNP
jgi:threonine synthase